MRGKETMNAKEACKKWAAAENINEFSRADLVEMVDAMFKYIAVQLAAQQPVAADLRHTCGDCGKELQIVRPGKYQCDCGASR